MDKTTRIEELEALYVSDGWQPIKKMAEALGIPKPNNGWDEAIPLIVEAEIAEQTKEVAKPPSVRVAIQDTPWRKARTDLHGNLIPNPFKS